MLLAGIFALLAGGTWYYRSEQADLQKRAESQLDAIATLKVGQIVEWRLDELAAAGELADSPAFTESVAQWLAQPRSQTAADILHQFRSLQKHYAYEDVVLLDATGEARLSASGRVASVPSEWISALGEARSGHRAALTDLYAEPGATASPHLAAVAPLFADRGGAPELVGAVVLLSEARKSLYPLVQSWPTSSPSAETLLVRREGEAVLFLSELRHRPGTAFELRLPLSAAATPAVRAVLGEHGAVRGPDYRGVEVLSVVKPIPGTPWHMVSKIDAAEAFSDWRDRSTLILALLLAIAAGGATAVALVWQRRNAAVFRATARHEVALRTSEEHFRLLFEHAPAALAMFDRDMRYLAVSRRWISDYGLGDRDLRGLSHYDVFPEIDERWKAIHRRALAGEVMREESDRFDRLDGSVQWLRWEVRPWRDAAGEVGGIVITSEDISERKRTEERTARVSERLSMATSAAHLGIWDWDVVNDQLVWDDRMYDLYGVKKEDFAGAYQAWLAGVHPDDRRASDASLRDALQSANEWQWRFRVVRPDGTVCHIRTIAAVVRDENKKPLRVIGINADVTERESAEAERARLALAIEQAAEAVLITDTRGIIQYVNPAFEATSGYSRAEVLGRNPRILKSGEHDQAFYRAMFETLSAGEVWTGRIINRRKDGTRYTDDSVISPVRDATGTIVSFVAVKRDVTEQLQQLEEQEKLRAQLIQAQKMESVGRLAGGVAHDFNNMLNVILGRAELALQRGPPASIRHDLEEILAATQRSADLTRQLLAFARKQTIQPRVLDLNDMVAGMQQLLKRLIGEDIDLVFHASPVPRKVRIDPSQIDQLLANLVVNSRDAIAGPGRVVITTSSESLDQEQVASRPGCSPGDYVVLSVQDDGSGMDPATLALIFEPFFTTKTEGRGTGLGLATVYGIVDQNHGSIDVTSEPGRGTTFRIYLPAAAAGHVAEPAGVIVETPRGNETVLLVEDEPSLLTLGKETLEGLGYRVLAANLPDAALRVAAEHAGTIELVITDVVMPGMNGRDLAERLLAARPGLRCLYMSGYTADVIAPHGVLDENLHFIQKPFSARQLGVKIRKVLDARPPS